MDYFRPYLEKGQNILYLALSSGLSDTFVVDSLCATAGMGLLLHYAGVNRTSGMSISMNVNWLN